jgi:hypothetical protein
MGESLVFLAHLLTAVAKLLGPGRANAVIAEKLSLTRQLLFGSHQNMRRNTV